MPRNVFFEKIGTATYGMNKKGRSYINLHLDTQKVLKIPEKDLERGIYLFGSISKGYDVMAPVLKEGLKI